VGDLAKRVQISYNAQDKRQHDIVWNAKHGSAKKETFSPISTRKRGKAWPVIVHLM
jgi:hypothetical protein